MKLAVALLAVVAGCQSNVSTPFPPGLEPLEDNPVTLTTVAEGLVTLFAANRSHVPGATARYAGNA